MKSGNDEIGKAENMAELKVILPALRRLVRFPQKSLGTVSVETQVELSVLKAWVGQHGMPDQERLERYEDQLAGVPREDSARNELPPVGANIPPPRPRVAIERAPNLAPATPNAERPTPNAQVKPVEAKRQPKDRAADYFKVCELMLLNPEMSANKACTQVGVDSGTWSYFKAKQFGPGAIDRLALRNFVEGDVRSNLEKPRTVAPPPVPDLAKDTAVAHVPVIAASESVSASLGTTKQVGIDETTKLAAQELQHARAVAALLRAAASLTEAALCLQGGAA